LDGILIINKAPGMTSHDVVARVRKLLKQRRVGHAGTLDPTATGVLPICIGQGTRVAEYLSESGKAYEARITFGVVTDTYDAEGEIIRQADATHISRTEIEQLLPRFLGRQMQMPPRYSAIKIQGQPAYKRMRSGEEVTMETRPIDISRLAILDWQVPHLTLAIECSKGTYIRSLAYDLGEAQGSGAYLTALQRTRSGPFSLSESITLEQLAEAIEQATISEYLQPADKALLQHPAFTLDEATTEKVLHGNPFPSQTAEDPTQPHATLARIYDYKGRFLAIATWNNDQQTWQPKKVLATTQETITD
jgi:tRNA pseudouridine55 synthase